MQSLLRHSGATWGRLCMPSLFSWTRYWIKQSLFFLDGSIITIGGNQYFRDRSSNGRNFLITGYDFDSNWTKGFPYKSAATISAPAGDAALIAADINSFLYTAGTPNQIPVISLFHDIDYEHKIFCKHEAQVVDGNGVETYEPRVIAVYMATAVLTGADLTKAQTDFGVPTEDATAKWVTPSPVGSDAAAGTKVAPWATFTKGLTENTGKTVYYKTGAYAHTAALASYANNNPVGLGFVRINNSATNYTLTIQAATPVLLKGIAINGTGTGANGLYMTTTDLLVVKYIKLTCNAGKNMLYNFKEVLNCIFNGTSSNSYASLMSNSAINKIIKDNLFAQSGQSYDVEIKTAAGIIDIKNNKFLSAPRSDAGSNILVSSPTGTVTVIGNYFKPAAALQTAFSSNGLLGAAMAEIVFAYNTIIDYFYSYKLIDWPNHQLHTPYVHHNKMLSYSGAGTIWRGVGFHCSNARFEFNVIYHAAAISTTGDDVDQDVLNGEIGAGITLSNYVKDNKIVVNRNAERHIIIGGTSSCDGNDKISVVEIERNCVKGYGYFNATVGSATGIGVFWQKNSLIRHNYIYGTYQGIVVVHDTDNTANGIFYNLIVNCDYGIYIQKLQDVPIYNNTIISNVNGAKGIYAEDSTDGSDIRNHIIILTGTGTVVPIRVATGSVNTIDYNTYYCPNGTMRFKVGSTEYTFAQWQALGYDAHSVVMDAAQYAALLNADYTPKTGGMAIGTGVNLGATYDDGLDASTNWGVDTNWPSVVTKQQGAAWDIGAYIH
jgi:hypothetical protein